MASRTSGSTVLKEGTLKKLSSTKSMGKFTWFDSECKLYADCFTYVESKADHTFNFTDQEIHVELTPQEIDRLRLAQGGLAAPHTPHELGRRHKGSDNSVRHRG